MAATAGVRFFVVVFAVVVLFTFLSGAQPHYPVFILPIPFAAGILAMERHLGRVWGALFALNGGGLARARPAAVPVGSVGATPVPDVNLLAQDSVGWPAYVAPGHRVYDALPDRGARRRVHLQLRRGRRAAPRPARRPVYSAQNALYDQARPPDTVTTVVVVGGQYPEVRGLFDRCTVRARLDNGVDVDNEEQGLPVAVCTGPVGPLADAVAAAAPPRLLCRSVAAARCAPSAASVGARPSTCAPTP